MVAPAPTSHCAFCSTPARQGIGTAALCRSCAAQALATLEATPDELRLVLRAGGLEHCLWRVARAGADLASAIAYASDAGERLAAIAAASPEEEPGAGLLGPTRLRPAPAYHGAVRSVGPRHARRLVGIVSDVRADFSARPPRLRMTVAGTSVDLGTLDWEPSPPCVPGDRVEAELDDRSRVVTLMVNHQRVRRR